MGFDICSPLPLSQPINGLKTGPGAKFVYYAGHDINLLFLRHFLDIEWYGQGWARSQSTLGGMLVGTRMFLQNLPNCELLVWRKL